MVHNKIKKSCWCKNNKDVKWDVTLSSKIHMQSHKDDVHHNESIKLSIIGILSNEYNKFIGFLCKCIWSSILFVSDVRLPYDRSGFLPLPRKYILCLIFLMSLYICPCIALVLFIYCVLWFSWQDIKFCPRQCRARSHQCQTLVTYHNRL